MKKAMGEKDKLKKKIFKEGEKKVEDAKRQDITPEEKKEIQEIARKEKKEVQEEKVPLEDKKETKIITPQPLKFFSVFPQGKIIKFMQARKFGYIISSILFIFSIFIILSGKVPLGIDFKGGFSADVKITSSSVNIEDLRTLIPEAYIQNLGENRFLIKLPLDIVERERTEEGLKKDPAQIISEKLKDLGGFEIIKVESVGSIIGRELREKGILAFVLSLLGIFIYISFRFEWRFAIGATLALIHDIVITLGIISSIGIELSIVTLAGLLTLAGYSVNDSVIVADRIREKLRFARGIWTSEKINEAITSTLPRTIITGLTTLFPSVSLIIFGGEVLRDLGITFTIGIIVGTYSSVFICSAIAYDIYLSQHKRRGETQKQTAQQTTYAKVN